MARLFLTMHDYSILMSLILQNGVLIIEGTKGKIKYVNRAISLLRNNNVIRFSKMLSTKYLVGNLIFWKYVLLDFEHSPFTVVDISYPYVTIEF